MLKRSLGVTIFVLLLVAMGSSLASAYDIQANLVYNGQYSNDKIVFQQEDTATYIPLRATFEKLGYTVNWNNETKEVYLVSPVKKNIFRYVIDRQVLIKNNGEALNMGYKIINGSIYFNMDALKNFALGYSLEKKNDGNNYFYVTLPEDTAIFLGEVKYAAKNNQKSDGTNFAEEQSQYAVDADQNLIQFVKKGEEILINKLNKEKQVQIESILVNKSDVIQKISSDTIPQFTMEISKGTISGTDLGPAVGTDEITSSTSSFRGQILVKRATMDVVDYTIDSKLEKVVDGTYRSQEGFLLNSDAITLNEREKWAQSESGKQMFIVKDLVVIVDQSGKIKDVYRETDKTPLCTYYDKSNKNLIVLYTSNKNNKTNVYINKTNESGSFGILPGFVTSFSSSQYGNPQAKILYTYNNLLYGIFNDGVSQYVFNYDSNKYTSDLKKLPDWVSEGSVALGHDGIYFVWTGGNNLFYCKLNI